MQPCELANERLLLDIPSDIIKELEYVHATTSARSFFTTDIKIPLPKIRAIYQKIREFGLKSTMAALQSVSGGIESSAVIKTLKIAV